LSHIDELSVLAFFALTLRKILVDM